MTEDQIQIRERLTSLETKLVFTLDLLKEIRDELKDSPSKEEYEELKAQIVALQAKVEDVEKKQNSMALKVGIAASTLGVVGGMMLRWLFKLLTGG